ncbi:unnamed protein product, partial [Rotaria sp. Silwood2]
QLSKSLANLHNEFRSQESGLTSKTKLALQSLGFLLKPKVSIVQEHANGFVNRKKRCYICSTHPGRKVQQVCDMCKQNVCKSHSTSITTVVCQPCEKNYLTI